MPQTHKHRRFPQPLIKVMVPLTLICWDGSFRVHDPHLSVPALKSNDEPLREIPKAVVLDHGHFPSNVISLFYKGLKFLSSIPQTFASGIEDVERK